MTMPTVDWRKLSLGEWLHIALVLFWVLLIPPTLLYWKDSVPYLVFINVYSIIVGHIAAFQGAKAERNSPDA